MKVLNITDNLIIKNKSQVEAYFKSLGENENIIFNSLSCIDLSNLDYIKNKYELLNSRFLLIYNFINLLTGERYFYGLPLSFSQTTLSYSHIFKSITWYEAEINRNFGIHFYFHDDRCQYEIVDRDKNFNLEKSCSSGELNHSYFKSKKIFSGEDIVLSVSKLSGQQTSSKINFNVNSINVKNTQIDIDFSKGIGLEKELEDSSANDVITQILSSQFRNKYFISLLWNETLDSLNGARASYSSNIQRMFFLEIFSAIENLQCLSSVFHSCCMVEVQESLNTKIDQITKHLNLDEIKTCDGFKNLLTIDDRKWLYELRDYCHDNMIEVQKIKKIVEGNAFIINLEDHFNHGQNALQYSLRGAPLQSLGYKYNLKNKESFYEYQDLEIDDALSLKGSTYELILIRLEELKSTFSNIIKICEEYPRNEERSQVERHLDHEEIYYSYTESVSGELSILSVINFNSRVDRFNLMGATLKNVEYFSNRVRKFSIPPIACEWNALGICESELVK